MVSGSFGQLAKVMGRANSPQCGGERRARFTNDAASVSLDSRLDLGWLALVDRCSEPQGHKIELQERDNERSGDSSGELSMGGHD